MVDYHIKEAFIGRSVWGAAKSGAGALSRLFNTSTWTRAGNLAAKYPNSKVMRGLESTAKVMGGKVGLGLTGYGMTGLMPGLDLPGSDLAFAASAPALAGLFAAPSLINSYRASSDENQKAIMDTVETGARSAAKDFITASKYDSGVAYNPGSYKNLLDQSGLYTSDILKGLKDTKKNSTWQDLQGLFSDSEGLINNRVDLALRDRMLRKEANILGSVGGGILKSLGVLGGVAGVGGAAHAVLRDKPFDEVAQRQKGYDYASNKIRYKIDNMSALQRMAVKLDPSLAISGLEKEAPGIIKSWETDTGQHHKPGWLQSLRTIGKHDDGRQKFYETDNKGKRHYL